MIRPAAAFVFHGLLLKMPPEGQQHPLNSSANTLVLAFVVAESAAKQAKFDSEQPQATACDAERAYAIDLWIARCPVEIPQTIMVGIKAILRAVSAECHDFKNGRPPKPE